MPQMISPSPVQTALDRISTNNVNGQINGPINGQIDGQNGVQIGSRYYYGYRPIWDGENGNSRKS